MKELLGHEVELAQVEDRIVERFSEVFEIGSEPAAVAAGPI
jgi:hypothetical protein